jgi:hypothetical protein
MKSESSLPHGLVGGAADWAWPLALAERAYRCPARPVVTAAGAAGAGVMAAAGTCRSQPARR